MDTKQFTLHAEMEDAHWWFRARREIMFALLKRYLSPDQGKLVAEIGCGTGGNLKFLQEHYRVIGVDTAPEAVSYARARTRCDILLGDFHDHLAARWHEIDALLLADVLEHIDDDTAFIGDIVSSLRPGAFLLITVPAHQFLWSNHDVVLGHRRRYSRQSLRALWNGLPVDELAFSPFNSLLFPLIAIYRLLKPAEATSTGTSDLRMPAPWVNRFLDATFSTETAILQFMPLPWGVSLVALLRKQETS